MVKNNNNSTKEDVRYNRTASPKALKICTENINLHYKNNLTSFGQGQNTANFYDNHILLTMICIFWPEFGSKRRYFALLLTLDQLQTLPNRSYFPPIMISSLTFTDFDWCPWNICNRCGMPAGNAYPSGHLVPSPFLVDLLMLQLLRSVFPNLSC